MLSNLIVSLLCLVLLYKTQLAESSTKTDLDNLNEYLMSVNPTSDFKENFEIILHLYQNEKNKSYKETLRQLISLRYSRCDKENLDTLLKINDALGGEAHLKRHKPLHRIDSVVWYLSTQHAKDCQSTYPINYEKKIQTLNQENVKYVKKFSGVLFTDKNKISLEDVQSMEQLFDHYLYSQRYKQGTGIVWNNQGRNVYNVLLANADDNEDAKFLKNVVGTLKGKGLPALFRSYTKVRSIYSKYLVTPCRHFVDKLGPEVYKPAIYDSILFHVADESKRGFYQDWYRFTLCQELLTNENRVLVKLLEIIDDQAKPLKLIGSIPTWKDMLNRDPA